MNLNFFNFFGKRKRPRKMSKKQKKNYLSNDLIDRMINVELQVSSSFGERKKYPETDYYKTLSEKQKHSYENFLRNKSMKRTWVFMGMALSVFLIPFFRTGLITGNVSRVGSETTPNLLNYFPFLLLGLFLFIFLFVTFRSRSKDRKVSKHVEAFRKIRAKRLKN